MPLPSFVPAADQRVLNAVRNLVLLKDAIDSSRRDSVTAALRPSGLTDRNGQVLSAFQFARHVVPFLSTDSDKEHLGRYPTDLIIAEPWRDRDLHPSDVDGQVAFLTSDERAMRGDRERAEYFLVEPLGLAIPNEGKNRVRFFREYGIAEIPCALTVLSYPSAERLALYEVDSFWAGTKRVICVLDSEYAQEVIAPGLTLPLLRAYGVDDLRPWPVRLPRLDSRRSSVSSKALASTFLRTVKLSEVARENERIDSIAKPVPVSTMELDLTPRLRPLLALCSTLAVAFIVDGFFPNALQTCVQAAIVAFVFGFGAALHLRWWKAPKAWQHRRGTG